MDLVAKLADAPYGTEPPWIKVKNRAYSQAVGRERFEKMVRR